MKNKNIIKWLLCGVGCFAFVCMMMLTFAIMIVFTRDKHQVIKDAHNCDEFQMYLDKYYRDLEFFGINKKKPRTIIMKLAPMQYFEDTKDCYGVSCGYNNDDLIEIYINEDKWEYLSRPQKYLLMYHELSHDILNVDDLPEEPENRGKLMCPIMLSFDKITMDEFIEMSHSFFEEYSGLEVR